VDEIPELPIRRRLHPQISQIGTDGIQASNQGHVPISGAMPGNATFLLETEIGSGEWRRTRRDLALATWRNRRLFENSGSDSLRALFQGGIRIH
jgi:hypothetical protein